MAYRSRQLELVVFEKDTPEKVQLEVEKKFNADFKKWIWRPCSQNAYGAFLCIAMSEGLLCDQLGALSSTSTIRADFYHSNEPVMCAWIPCARRQGESTKSRRIDYKLCMVLLTHSCFLVSSRLGASDQASGHHVDTHDSYSAGLRHPNPAEYSGVRFCQGLVSKRIFSLVGLAHTLLVFDDGQRSSSCAILGHGVVHEVRFADFEM